MRRRKGRARERFGALGAFAAWWTDGPQHERAWAHGATGEEENAARLAKLLRDHSVLLLHDRRMPGKRSNIDHIAVGPGGITVVDSKNLTGKVRVDWSGGLFSARRWDLYVGGRKRTNLVEKLEAQVHVVRAACAELGHTELPVMGALCMATAHELPLLRKPKIRDVTIDGPRGVAKLIARPGPLTRGETEELARELARTLPPA